MKERQDYQIVLYFKNDSKLSLYKFDLLQKKILICMHENKIFY